MVFFWKRRRGRKNGAEFPQAWRVTLEALPFYGRLAEPDRARLQAFVSTFLPQKNWEGCGGLEIDDGMRVSISAQAGLLVLGLHHSFYRRIRSILVYPHGVRNAAGVGFAGEAMMDGPLLLTWDAVREGVRNPDDGRNVVFHEFAHKLDMLDGRVDGAPPLPSASHEKRWNAIVERDYEKLARQLDRGRKTFLDSYAATNHAEFFAVTTEAFFEQPKKLEKLHPELYDLLVSFYRQDPARRLGVISD